MKNTWLLKAFKGEDVKLLVQMDNLLPRMVTVPEKEWTTILIFISQNNLWGLWFKKKIRINYSRF